MSLQVSIIVTLMIFFIKKSYIALHRKFYEKIYILPYNYRNVQRLGFELSQEIIRFLANWGNVACYFTSTFKSSWKL